LQPDSFVPIMCSALPKGTQLPSPLELYKTFCRDFAKDRCAEEASARIVGICEASLAYLAECKRQNLMSKVPGKEYFSFLKHNKPTRPVNAALFGSDCSEVIQFMEALRAGTTAQMEAARITRACYTVAISFSCAVDLQKTNDQKTPGTFFEYFVCHLFARRLGIQPRTRIDVLNLDRPASLPTDWIFDLGVDQPKFHLPVKTSTRERVIQVWAHQRVLDGVYGVGRFLGTLVCMAETKLDHRKLEVVEICLPEQWRIYQMFIAQMRRIYYLDVPKPYEPLNQMFPRINVRPFGEFFGEAESLCECV
jgi:hypothetical protein